MPHFDTILAVLLAGLALSATPGPSMLYVLSRTVGQDRMAGFASAFGLALGGMALAVATALGLAAVFEQFTWVVPTLRYVGSAYLIWLGLGMIWEARAASQTDLEVSKVSRRSTGQIVWQGFLVELMNPKTVLFFALFLPPFISMGDGSGSVELQFLILGALVPLTAIPSDMVVVFMGSGLTGKLNERRHLREAMGWIGGLMLILIALNLHLGFI
ncbi:LysE family translocator [Phaeobacter sp. CNT1-3]|jgi:threonine/homoserine/homoserine lactone efflux protein|nr:LysE family translocator [Phaeobacter sp. CNT1-3]